MLKHTIHCFLKVCQSPYTPLWQGPLLIYANTMDAQKEGRVKTLLQCTTNSHTINNYSFENPQSHHEEPMLTGLVLTVLIARRVLMFASTSK